MGTFLTSPCLLVLGLLSGCIDWDAAGSCYDDAASCEVADPCTGASRCAGLASAVCDGFEESLLSPLWYVIDSPPATTATLDASRSCRGQSSLHLHVAALAAGENGRAQIQEHQSELPVALADRWIRMFAFVPASAVTAARNHMVEVLQSGTPYQGITLDVAGGVLAVRDELSTLPTPVYSRTAWPTERWVCAVFRIRQGSPGDIQVSLDGMPVTDLQLSDETDPSPPFGEVLFGAAFDPVSQPQGDVDLWVDEIVVAGSPLDCGS